MYKGIYHSHSTYSADGKLTLADLRAICLRLKLQFIVMTEHAEDMTPQSLREYVADCNKHSDGAFLFIPGIEIPYKDGSKVHIGCFPVEAGGTVPMFAEGIRALREKGAVSVLHHPQTENYYFDEHLPEIIDLVELWNSRYEGKIVPSITTANFVKKHFPDKSVIGGLDVHSKHQFGGPVLCTDVPELRTDLITKAIASGDFVIAGKYYRFGSKAGRTSAKVVHQKILRGLYQTLLKIRNVLR